MNARVLGVWALVTASVGCFADDPMLIATAGTAGSAEGGSGTASATSGTTSQGGQTQDGSGPGDGTEDGGESGDATGTLPDCDPSEAPDPMAGVFVRASTGMDTGAGNAVSPLATLGAALELARTTGRSHIYLAPGLYAEAVVIEAVHSGITIEGGWEVRDVTWTRNCSTASRDLTVIQSPATTSPTVDVTDDVALFRFENATIDTLAMADEPSPDQPGQSLIAMRVAGANARVELDNVVLRSGKAGDGGMATMPAAAGTVACNGVADCADGTPGSGGSPGGPADGGLFDPQGYVPGDGRAGNRGNDGRNGTPGADGGTFNGCYVSCVVQGSGCQMNTTSISSGAGECGCGGEGGAPGSVGRGGGASIALYVSGTGSTVELQNSLVASGDGGNGSPGAPGAAGGPGRDGMHGSNQSCEIQQTCVFNNDSTQCIPQTNGTHIETGGAAGGGGGDGGPGGRGGDGAGGPSCPIVSLAETQVDVGADVELEAGQPGMGPGSAPDGMCPAM